MPTTDSSLQSRPSCNLQPHHLLGVAPPVLALALPFLLMLFHAVVGPPDGVASTYSLLVAALVLASTFAAPVLGIVVACQPGLSVRLRRLAYASVLAPTLYVFLGVVQTLLGSPVPDPWVWCILWSVALVWAVGGPRGEGGLPVPASLGRWRVAHGVSAALLCLYVLFHLGNHLTGLLGAERYAAVMDAGRLVYRAAWVEPLLVAAVLFQIASGLRLAWYWSAARHDGFRTFQVASGAYLSAFMLGHMNSVFIYARAYLGIATDWNFATGAPAGLIHDPWNIRLLPHYALGVFFVLGHLVAGLRVVLMAHGTEAPAAKRLWCAGILASAALAAAIIAGMCGVRL